MPCPAEDILDGFAAGRLDEATYEGVERHLDACDECLRVVTALNQTASSDVDPGSSNALSGEPGFPAIGRYRVLEILGEGGMGRVYLAHDPQLDRRVALKVLRADYVASPSARARMVTEARTMARIVHPNIVTVFDAGEVEGTAYIAMELVVGTTLARWLDDAPRSAREVLAVFAAAGSALVAAHEAGVVHRDFKPANVLVDATGRIAVTDFGIASSGERATLPDPFAATRIDPRSPLTQTGTLMGTPAYMSPEQFAHARVDARSDQFSFAVGLFGALYGQPPFVATSVASRASAAAWVWRPLDDATRKRARPGIHVALRRALSFDPADRFPDLRSFLAALDDAARPRAWRGPLIALVATLAIVGFVTGARGYLHPHALPAAPDLAAATAASTVLTLLDLPMPTSANPEALKLYREALVAQHDGVKSAYKLFQRAVAKDPELAAAYLRHTVLELSTDDPDRQAASLDAYRHAIARRDRLSPRDLALSDALEPALLVQPADWATCEARLRAAIARAPLDENLVTTLGQVLAVDGKLAEADESFARAIALDPTDVGTRALRADEQLLRGDLEGAGATASACLAESPRSTRCISVLFAARSIEGRCHETEALSQRLITANPEDNWGYLDLFESELALEEPDETVVATEERVIRTIDPGSRDWAKLHFPWLRALLEGDFARAEGLIDQEQALAVRAGNLGDQVRALSVLATSAMETGNLARAGRAADAYVKRKQALPAPSYVTRNVVARDHVPVMLTFMRDAGLLSADEARRRRDAWLRDWQVRFEGREASFLWLEAYALPAETRADAEEALAHAPSDLGPLLVGDELEVEAIGRVDVLAGRFAEAVPLLESASRQCRVRRFPLAIPRASYYLGLAREGTGDKAGACEAYATVLRRWGHALKVRPETAERASRRVRALGCRENGG